MINLLPDETKRQIRAAHTNTMLVKYLLVLGFAIGFLVLACTASYFFLVNTKESNQKILDSGQSQTSIYSVLKKQVDTLRSNLSTATSILDEQVSYSSIIMEIASVLPSGVVMDSLNLDGSTLGTPITLQLRASSSNIEPEIKQGFQSKPQLFSNYNLQTITTAQGDASGLSALISISITINKGIVE